MKREEILARAKDIVSGDRDKTYGVPENSFNRIAQLWQAYLKYPIDSGDVAMMMVLFKIARLQVKPNHEDSWIDIAGYAACGGELATTEVGEAREVRDKPEEKSKGMTPEDWKSVEKIKESDRLYAEAMRSAHNG